MPMDPQKALFPVAVALLIPLFWMLREAVWRLGFIVVLGTVGVLVLPFQASFTTAPGVEPKSALNAATDIWNPAYRRWKGEQLIVRLAKFAHAVGCTPNQITLVSLLCVIAGSFECLCGHAVAALLFWWAYALLDELDGTVARNYGLSSKLGERFDLLVDVGAHLLFAMGTLCSPHGQGGFGGFCTSCVSLTAATVLMQVYDDALDIARVAEGLRAADTALVALGFASETVKAKAVKAALPSLGRFGHGWCRFVANPLAMLCYLRAGLLAQLAVLALQLFNAAAVWSRVASLRRHEAP